MSAEVPSSQKNRSSKLQLMLIDDDAIFRLGLRVWLDQFEDLQVVAEANSGRDALEKLAALAAPGLEVAMPTAQPEAIAFPTGLDLIILNVGLGQGDAAQIQGLTLCQQLKARYPALAILLLSPFPEPLLLAAAQQAGADGYCPRNLNVAELAAVIRQVAMGQSRWIQPTDPTLGQGRNQTVLKPDLPSLAARPGILARFRQNLRVAGVRRIEAEIAHLKALSQSLATSSLEQAVLDGRLRELQAARWIVQQLLATPRLPAATETEAPSVNPPELPRSPTQTGNRPSRPRTAARPVSPTSLLESEVMAPVLVQETALNATAVQATLFDAIAAKLQGSLQNQTDLVLEIDILREEKKRELLYLLLRKLENLLDELRYSQIQPEQLLEKQFLILQDWWAAGVSDFFGKYYTVQLSNVEIEVVPAILQEAETVEREILAKIPYAVDLLAHLLFLTPLTIDDIPYAVGNPESMLRAEMVLDHLLIQMANAVMQPLLNQFANVETIKHNFYSGRHLSSREIERFRNELSWRYRRDRLVDEPKAIFESQYRLLTLQLRGIRQVSIYAPRNQELEELTGLPYAVTILLEARDAIAPRLRATVAFVGSGLIYLLTDVIGRGIGLIGRGILKGVGSAWQDTRFNRNGERQK